MKKRKARGAKHPKSCEVGEFVVLGKRLKIGPRALIRSHTVIYPDVKIGADFRSGHGALIREGTEIGDGVSIGSGTVIEHHVEIGDGVRIHSNAFIPEYTRIESGAWIGPGVVLTNALYPNSADAKKNLKGPRLCANCIIGANATLLPGITIGRGTLVGAGSVVVDDLPPGVVAAGNPARILKKIKDLPAYRKAKAR